MRPLLLALGSALLASCASVRTLSDADFRAIQVGTSEEQTRAALGVPFETMAFPLSRTHSWDYRYYDAWGYLSAFSVIFDANGKVQSTITQRLNDGGDHGT